MVIMKKNKTKEGIFIVFEGIDKCGKSSVLANVVKQLTKQGFPVVTTREPGGNKCPLAESIRKTLLDPNIKMYRETEMYLFAASRTQHIRNFIIPNLERNKIVISDRFLWSSLVYQGKGRNIGRELVSMINTPAVDDLSPDIIILFDIPATIAWKRSQKQIDIQSKKQKLDRFEREGIKFQESLRQEYLKLARANHQAIIIDAQPSVEEVTKDVLNKILARIPAAASFQ